MGPQTARRPATKAKRIRSLLFIRHLRNWNSRNSRYRLDRLFAGALARGIRNYLQILRHHRWLAHLLLEVLFGNPFEAHLADHKGLRIHLRVVNRDGDFQGVMVHAGVAFVHPHIDAVRMPYLVQPAPVVTPDRIHDEAIIPIPVPYRVSVPPGIWRISGSPAHILGKLPTIRPDFTPHPVVLKHLDPSHGL